MGESNKILEKMLERLYASLTNGPVLSCRPHSSRQRIDLAQIARIAGSQPGAILNSLLSPGGECKVTPITTGPGEADAPSAKDQQQTFAKLRTIIEDAKSYESDTGVHILYLGYPILNLPPQSFGSGKTATKRVLAPLCFIPMEVSLRTMRQPSVTLATAAEGSDLVIPNLALLAWVEQTTGKKILNELEDDQGGADPWAEINDVTRRVCEALDVARPDRIGPDVPVVATPRLESDESKSPCVFNSAVLGLYPVSNQGLLRDLEALVAGEVASGPIQNFLRADAASSTVHTENSGTRRQVGIERFVTIADPCQARAVRLARRAEGLVVHGPPGTGKSQTIANMVGDHLARGQRVLFVCDKRTALDVVQQRLAHLGLGHLCAIVHDAQRDQRDLYRSLRDQLDQLPDFKTNPHARGELEHLDRELQFLHDKLSTYHHAVSTGPSGSRSFHDLAGEWMSISVPDRVSSLGELAGVDLATVLSLERPLREIFERAGAAAIGDNPWYGITSLTLQEYRRRPLEEIRAKVAEMKRLVEIADATNSPEILGFDLELGLLEQGAAREKLAKNLTLALADISSSLVSTWAAKDAGEIANALSKLNGVEKQIHLVENATPEPELDLALQEPARADAALGWLGKLGAYLEIVHRWYAFIYFGRKRTAFEVVQRFGLLLSSVSAERVAAYLRTLVARRVLESAHKDTLALPSSQTLASKELIATTRAYMCLLQALTDMHMSVPLRSIFGPVREALLSPERHGSILRGLRASDARSRAVAAAEDSFRSAGLFSSEMLSSTFASLRAGKPFAQHASALDASVLSLEKILKIEELLGELPLRVRDAVRQLLPLSLTADEGFATIRRSVLRGVLSARLRDEPTLLSFDHDSLRTGFDHYAELQKRKLGLVREAITHDWAEKQRRRVLATTGSRLSSVGSDLKRRLMLKGERALRLRQVVAAGISKDAPDPLFDMRPVWMVSPETVAQIFPRAALFDLVIFDEASQCRLEHALPVLLRAKRVVIAGDPQQLPPTRFFESSVVQADEGEEDLSEQGLFEGQQSEVEDLLAASLNMAIEQCYLDVHYRSQSSDLIKFSNDNFYDGRLQAIPSHPRWRAKLPALRLHAVQGVYVDRTNLVEAVEVVRIVENLLSSAEPPSIGIACFNIAQRDLIVEKLEEYAAQSREFEERLAIARKRQGGGSFEGLFVKNIENVQGDERDQIIISTTYGPDKKGKFYRRFGPLAQNGGGRRLNVLVTRARSQVHVVTSIPPIEYRATPTLEPGKTPNGAWLLFAYLRYAEDLARLHTKDSEFARAEQSKRIAGVSERPTGTPSVAVTATAQILSNDQGVDATVYWGNDGFCVDVALHDPTCQGGVSVGVLCDGSRYERSEDPVEWDAFRTQVLKNQGWQLHRVCTPELVQNRVAVLEAVRQSTQRAIAEMTAAR